MLEIPKVVYAKQNIQFLLNGYICKEKINKLGNQQESSLRESSTTRIDLSKSKWRYPMFQGKDIVYALMKIRDIYSFDKLNKIYYNIWVN